MEEVRSWVFTFRGSDVDANGDSLADRYVVINGTYDGARKIMMDARGKKWGFQYKNGMDAGVQEFNLEIILLRQIVID